MSKSPPYNYRCPNLECRAEYLAVHRTDAALRKPKCIECTTPFLATEKGRYIPRGRSGAARLGLMTGLMIDPKPKLIAALANTQEYLDLAVSAQDRGEREFHERIAE